MTRLEFKRFCIYGGIAVAASAGTLLAVRAHAAGISDADALTYTGYLENPDGTPVAGPLAIAVELWDDATAGKKRCEQTNESVTPQSGRFQLTLPQECTDAVAVYPNLWADVKVDGASLGRTRLGAVPYAIESRHSVSADSADSASGTLATELTDKVSQGASNVTLACPASMSRLESTCIDNVASSATTGTLAIKACHDGGKELCRIEQLYACDILAPKASGCSADTDDVAAIVWSGSLAQAVDALYTYGGNNAVTAEGVKAVMHPYYCCLPLGVTLE